MFDMVYIRRPEGESMTEGPINKTLCSRELDKYPQSRLLFVTIKDNGQNGPWTKIGKVRDWIKLYSDKYIIVKGTAGGIHFHLLAGIKKNAVPRSRSGIHFHMTTINKTERDIVDPIEIRDSQQIADIIRENKVARIGYGKLDPFQQCKLLEIAAAIRNHFRKKKIKQQTQVRKTKKQESIIRLLDYLYKNLNEPRSNEIREYQDYIVKI